MTDTKPAAGVTRLGPHSIEAEEAVLGSVLINPEAMTIVSDFLEPGDFFELKHAWIWETLRQMYAHGEAIDNLTVVEALRNRNKLEDIGGPAYITYLINSTPTHIYAETYGRIVERAAVRRRLMAAAGEIAQLAREESAELQDVISHAEATLFGVTERGLRKEMTPMTQAVREYFDRIEHLYNNPEEQLGLPCGFRDLDQLLGGFQKSDLCIVAGRPGVGKTSFLLGIALNAARAGARVAIFSLEMSHEQLIQRFYAVESGINSTRLRTGKLEPHEWDLFVEVTGRLDHLSISIDDSPGIAVQQMRARCRRLYRENGLDMIIIDYLQLMSGGPSRVENRVQEISTISRGLKELARELNVPVIAGAQLSRAVEQRSDKRPILSDLRESGCLAGETLIYLPGSGRYVPIRELENQTGFEVSSLDVEAWKLKIGAVTNAFHTGWKPVHRLTTQLGRSIRATANHQFLTFQGWKRLDELTTDDYIALPRVLSGPYSQSMSDAELALLGHMIGDGCALPSHALQYTTREDDLAQVVAALAVEVFGDQVAPRVNRERDWYQVYLPSTRHLTHGVRNPISVWLDDLGIARLRSYEKHIPDKVFAQPHDAIALFLRHLWATDGCIHPRNNVYPAIYYASSSEQLAQGVQALLLRLGINARIKRVPQKQKGRDQYHVVVSGNQDLSLFISTVGTIGRYKQQSAQAVAEYLSTHPANTNRDVIPHAVWRMHAVPAMQRVGLTSRQMQAELGNAYCGTGLYKQNISRERATRLAQVVKSEPIRHLAESDVYWDKVGSVEPDGATDVYDLTVPGFSNFVANNIVVHNSIEQDSDIVMFLYRDELYNENTERPNQADVIVAKHRNGPTGIVSLYFRKELTQFVDMVKSNVNLSDY